jgi:DNA-binding GntR family transcriptional regulator/FixJ family two-component response regulator
MTRRRTDISADAVAAYGYGVDSAVNGAEALAKAGDSLPTLVIADLLMPVMDGYTLLRHWKLDEKFKDIPFIVYTATYTAPEDERLAIDLGADAFIVKPMEPDQLMARIRRGHSHVIDAGSKSAHAPTANDRDIVTQYSATLVRKLEQKTIQETSSLTCHCNIAGMAVVNAFSLDRDRAYLTLRDLVISGEFSPNEPLSERTLSSRLALGRTPVREALQALAKDGLLTIHPMRGTFVRQMSFDDLREIHELRLALEGMAACLAATRGSTDAMRICAAELNRVQSGSSLDVEEAQQIGWAFHDEIFRATLNTRLTEAYDVLRAQSGLALQKIQKYSSDRTRQAVKEHLNIYAAIDARDSATAQQLMWQHLSSAFEARLSALGALRPQMSDKGDRPI